MACPKCGGRMKWEDRSYTGAGMETPAHWSCIACGKIVWPDREKQGPLMKAQKTISEEEAMEKENTTKICKRCGTEKSIEEFGLNGMYKDGHESRCKRCLKDLRVSRQKSKTGSNGNGRRRSGAGYHPAPAGPKPPPPPAPPVGEALYIDPAAIRALKRGVGKELLQEFSRFLDERYA